MSNLNEQDIAKITEAIEETKNKPVEMVCYSTDLTIGELLKEWEDLIEELSEKEIGLIYLKEYYESESHKMETTVDFKELYGKNNADIRKHHIKTELADVVEQMTLLKLSIDWINRRISLVHELVQVKRTIMEGRKQ